MGKVRAGWFNVRYHDSLGIFEPILQFLKDFRKNRTGQRAQQGSPVIVKPWRVSFLNFDGSVGAADRCTANTATAIFYMLGERKLGCRLERLGIGEGFAYVDDDSDDVQEVRKVCMKLDTVIVEDGSTSVRVMSFEDGGIIVLRGSTPVEPITLSILASSWV